MSAHAWFQSWLVARKSHNPVPRRKARRPWLRLEQLECRDVPSSVVTDPTTWHFDFGPAGSPAVVGYTAVSAVPARGNSAKASGDQFGWLGGKVRYADLGTADPLTRDFALTADGTFYAQLAPGKYAVTLRMGGDTVAHDQMAVYLEGAAADTVTAAANQVVTKTYTVTVTDGQLTLRLLDLGGADPYAILNALDVVPIVPLTATFSSGGPVNEGGTQTVSFANVTGGAGGYKYSYDFNNDGVFDVVNSTQATITVPSQYLADGPAARVVHARVTDSAGATADYATSIQVRNVAPTIRLSGPFTGTAGAPVAFSAAVTDPSSADAAAGFRYAWSFGDFATSTQQAPTHAYATAGTWTVTLTIFDKDGGVSFSSASVTVAGPVTGSFTNSGTVAEGGTGTVSFGTATGGTGPYKYSYDFNNDGVFDVVNSTQPTATVPAQYLADGPFARVVRGRITDAAGAYADYTTTIQVTNTPPTVNPGGPYSGTAGAAVGFAATATDPSPADAAAGFTYRWSFGDFATATGANPTHTYAAPGTYTVTVTAIDKDGASSTTNVSVTVIGQLSGTFGNAGSVAEGGTGAVSFANVTGGTGPYTYGYDFNNDGTFEVTGSAQASAAVPASYLADGPSARTVRGRVTDAAGRFADFTTSITVTNVPPAATAGGAGQSATQGVSTSFALGSFTDPGANDGPWTIAVNWGDNTTTTFTNSLQGAQSRAHTYAAAGTYTITMTVTDKDGGTATAATGVTATSPLSATFGNGGAVNEGGTGTVSFANASGGTGPYTYSYDFNNDGTFEVTGSTSPTATVPASYLPDGPATRVVRGRVKDSSGAFTDYTTTITVNNAPPTATLGNSGPVTSGATGTVTFANPSDPSAADAAAGFKYSLDFNNDGTFEVTDGGSASATVPASYLSLGTHVVKGRIKDKDGGFTDYTTSITVVQGSSTNTAS
ncbi:MAG TPA: PKD domain-containing protein, partial [Gemmataceae bacterium]